MEQILTSIKKLLSIDASDDNFDKDILIFLEGIIETLKDIGVMPISTFTGLSEATTWLEYLGETPISLNTVKTYMYLKTKLVFDPQPSSFVLESMKAIIQESEWRLAIRVEPDLVVEEVIPE